MPTDYDYLLNEIRRNLHDPKGSRAAVMVGAGFSKNSVSVDGSDKSFPSWNELTRRLVALLYPPEEQKEILHRAGATSTASRLAQEFQVAFGRSALIELVRRGIPDDQFQPGPLHRDLLNLPWADVFTTNYDCQLERASVAIRRVRYGVVRSEADLPVARRPRIIKLHGTLPDLENLILTEDDFRAYPRRHAPLVNIVRSSLAESSFCLAGFSGDDPNFLAWTGWVRDELRDSAPYVYLFSGDYLKPFQRRMLEDRRVIPINLLELFRTNNLAEAYRLLFESLSSPVGDLVLQRRVKAICNG